MGNRFKEILQGRPVILGHRGSPGLAQENSIESFLLALKAGADGVELDVHGTTDGVLIVYHDENLADGRFVCEHKFADVKLVAQRQKLEVHTLEEVFRALSGKGFINIELKCTGIEAAALQFARDLLPPETFLFSSFLPDAVAACRKLAADVPAIWIHFEADDLEKVMSKVREIDASGVAFHHSRITESLAAFFKSREIPLFTWTVNDLDEAKRMESLGVAGIITDVPGELISMFRQ